MCKKRPAILATLKESLQINVCCLGMRAEPRINHGPWQIVLAVCCLLQTRSLG